MLVLMPHIFKNSRSIKAMFFSKLFSSQIRKGISRKNAFSDFTGKKSTLILSNKKEPCKLLLEELPLPAAAAAFLISLVSEKSCSV